MPRPTVKDIARQQYPKDPIYLPPVKLEGGKPYPIKLHPPDAIALHCAIVNLWLFKRWKYNTTAPPISLVINTAIDWQLNRLYEKVDTLEKVYTFVDTGQLRSPRGQKNSAENLVVFGFSMSNRIRVGAILASVNNSPFWKHRKLTLDIFVKSAVYYFLSQVEGINIENFRPS